LAALYAYKTAVDPVLTAHTIPLVVPLAEIEGVALVKETELWEDGVPGDPEPNINPGE
jgi:hypothetical protein